jgi:hypothetical protein
MPSSMIHLLTAYKYNSKASVDFWVGNIAPDSVNDRKEKDKIHFRDKSDRLNALRDMASTINSKDDFSQGLLLHLYLDYFWDLYPVCNYIKKSKDSNWFQLYRNEISLAGAWLFHNKEWSKTVWHEMEVWPMSVYKNIYGIVKEDVADFIGRNNKWYTENEYIGPSKAFTPEFVEEFTSKVATDFKNWL